MWRRGRAPTEAQVESLRMLLDQAMVALHNRHLLDAAREAWRESLQRSVTDDLTGLGNRARLDEQLSRALDADESVGLIYVDLDSFKAVNDTYGHDAGDRLLAGVAGRIAASVGPDAVPIRLGGDEFVIVVTDMDQEAAIRLAQRVMDALGAPLALDSSLELRPSASIGGGNEFAAASVAGRAAATGRPRDVSSEGVERQGHGVRLADRGGRGGFAQTRS